MADTARSMGQAPRVRLSVCLSHPIHNYLPLFRRLAQSSVVDLSVLYFSDHGIHESYDCGFDRSFAFDLPLTEGYHWRCLRNSSPKPSVARPLGLVNLDLAWALSGATTDVVLIHGYQYVSNWIAFGAVRARGIPYMLRGESRIDHETNMPEARRWLKRAVLQPLVRSAAACLAIGSLNREFYAEYGAQPGRIVSCPYSIDIDRIESGASIGRRDRIDRLRSVGLDPSLPTVLFSGKLQTWKRPADAIMAAGLMRERANLVLIGDGPLRRSLEALIAGSDRVKLVGFVNQHRIAEWYGACDVLVMPSEREPWGLAVNEAIAAGVVPVVSDSVGCAPDLVTVGTGRVFRTGDLRAIARSLDEVVGSDRLMAALRLDGRRRLNDYSVESTACGIERATLIAAGQLAPG